MMMGKKSYVMPTECAVLHRPTAITGAGAGAASWSQKLAYGCGVQVVVDKEVTAMEAAALKMSSRTEQQQQSSVGVLSDEAMGWGFGEKGNFLGDGFSVDELLDLGDFSESDDKANDLGDEEAGEVLKVTPLDDTTPPSSSSSPEVAAALAGISLPAHDVADLEWVSYIIDDSLSEFNTISGADPASATTTAPPPVPSAASATKSVDLTLESSHSNAPITIKSDAFLSPSVSNEAHVPVRAKRTKRRRNAAAPWSNSGLASFTDSSSSCSSDSSIISDLGIHQSSLLFDNPQLSPDFQPQPKKQKAKKRGRKPKNVHQPSVAASPATSAAGERRCSHCGVQKTPQWRAGPEGAKTLCNACGVRYKSGRLLPEYRPACSPTFENSIHSNSHRKVLEMRRKKESELTVVAPPVMATC